jgi:hypothetical protein
MCGKSKVQEDMMGRSESIAAEVIKVPLLNPNTTTANGHGS